MGSITTMFVFVWMVNILIFLAQAAMIDMSPEPVKFYNSSGSVLEQYSTDNNINMPNSDQASSDLNPASAESESGGVLETLITFIDAIASTKKWIQDHISYFTSVILGPYNIIKAIPGLPLQFVGAIGILWYGLSIFLLIAFIFGRNV